MYKYLLVLVLFASCATPNKLKKIMDKLPEATAKECNQRFPIKETIDTVYTVDSNVLKSYEDEYTRLNIKIDSLLGEGCDTLYIDRIKEVIKQLPAKTNTKVIVKTQESTAKIQVMKDSCDKMVSGLVAANENNAVIIQNITAKNDSLRKQNTWLWLVIVIAAIWIFRKRILSLVKHII